MIECCVAVQRCKLIPHSTFKPLYQVIPFIPTDIRVSWTPDSKGGVENSGNNAALRHDPAPVLG